MSESYQIQNLERRIRELQAIYRGYDQEMSQAFERSMQNNLLLGLSQAESSSRASAATRDVEQRYAAIQQEIQNLQRSLQRLLEQAELERRQSTAPIATQPTRPAQEDSGRQQEERRLSLKAAINPGASVEALIDRGFSFLEDAEWDKAWAYFDSALDKDTRQAKAYVGMLCVELEITEEANLVLYHKALAEFDLFKKALRYADSAYRETLETYDAEIAIKLLRQMEKKLRQAEEEQRRLEEERAAEEQRLKEEQLLLALKRREEGLRAEEERLRKQRERDDELRRQEAEIQRRKQSDAPNGAISYSWWLHRKHIKVSIY